jgi:hypothetical protein
LDHYEVHDPASIEKIAEDIRGVVDAFAMFWPRLRNSLRPSTSAEAVAGGVPPPLA